MSNSHFIKQLFKIEDENLTISQELVEEERNGAAFMSYRQNLATRQRRVSVVSY